MLMCSAACVIVCVSVGLAQIQTSGQQTSSQRVPQRLQWRHHCLHQLQRLQQQQRRLQAQALRKQAAQRTRQPGRRTGRRKPGGVARSAFGFDHRDKAACWLLQLDMPCLGCLCCVHHALTLHGCSRFRERQKGRITDLQTRVRIQLALGTLIVHHAAHQTGMHAAKHMPHVPSSMQHALL